MAMMTERDEPTDAETLDALFAGGVQDWAWYEEAVYELTDEERKNPSLMLDALLAAGVQDWEWYGESLKALYPVSEPDEETPAVPDPEVETLAEPEPVSVQRLRALLGDEYESQKDSFWKRTTHPKQFQAAMREGGTLENIRNVYLDRVFGVGAGR